MDLLEIHKRIRLALNKDDVGYLTTQEIDRALDRAQLQEFRHLYGDDRKLPDSPLAYGMTLKIHSDLLPFKNVVEYNQQEYDPIANPFGTRPHGIMVFPPDYLYMVSLVTNQNVSVKIVSEDEIGIRLSSIIRRPTYFRPIAVIGASSGSRAQIFPDNNAYALKMYYLQRPAAPNFVGVVIGRVLQYDAANSTQMQWNDTSIDRIIERAIAILGENMQEDKIGGDNFQKAQA